MDGGVKFIFKTLLKVPILLLLAYTILNAFSFVYVYFQVLSLSYIVSQTAVENNYLPQNQLQELYDCVDKLNDIPMVENASIIVAVVGKDTENPQYIAMKDRDDVAAYYTNDLTAVDARSKVQYGNEVTVGVTCEFKIIWPLDFRSTKRDSSGNVTSTDDANFSGKVEGTSGVVENNLVIVYSVPGLKYYPDLLY